MLPIQTVNIVFGVGVTFLYAGAVMAIGGGVLRLLLGHHARATLRARVGRLGLVWSGFVIGQGVLGWLWLVLSLVGLLYAGLVWGLVLIGVSVLLAGFDQPIVLLVISAVVGGFMMFVYSGLLILINRKSLPKPIKVTGFRLGALIWAIALFGTLSVLTFRDQLSKLFGGG